MWEEILSLALGNGLWAALFVGLMVYFLRDSSKREKKYQDTIEYLASTLESVEEIKADIKDIKEEVRKK